MTQITLTEASPHLSDREHVRFADQSFALTPSPSPKLGRGEQDFRFPFSQSWEKGLGDEGFSSVTYTLSDLIEAATAG